MTQTITQTKGLFLAALVMCLHALLNIYFKVIAAEDFHFMVFLSLSLVFSGFAMTLVGGKSHLALPALRSPYTWFYAVTYIVKLFLILHILQLISATEMTSLGRAATVTTFLAGIVFLKRNTLGRGAWAVIPIALGLLLILSGVKDDLVEVLWLTLLLALVNTAFFLSMELHDVSKKTSGYLQDIGVIGYIMGATGTVFIVILLASSLIFRTTTQTWIPVTDDFSNPYMFMNALFYGVFAVSITRYLEFKSIQIIKSETFACVAALILFMTLIFESSAYELGFLHGESIELDARMLGALFLLMGGSLMAIILRYTDEYINDTLQLEELHQQVLKALVFFDDDHIKTSNALGVSPRLLHDILTESTSLKIRKNDAQCIKANYERHIANVDALTGLSGRLQFMAYLKSINPNSPYSLLFIDLNKFKSVNDTYGHEAGDEVLKEIGSRLQKLLLGEGMVARLGGDEFAIMLNMEKAEAAKQISKIEEIISKPINFEGNKLQVGAAIGIATYPEDGTDAEQLLDIADKNMYKNKNDR